MNSEVDGNIIKEQELEEYLKKITENDADFTGKIDNIHYDPSNSFIMNIFFIDAMLASILALLSEQ